MSQANVDLVRRGFEFTSATGQLLRDIYQHDFVWDMTTFSGVGGLGMNTESVGFAAANSWLAEWTGGFEDWSLDVEEVFDAGDQVVTFVRQHAKAKHGGPDVEMRFAQVWTLRDGLIARMEMYADRAEALEAAGVRE